jgi:hypothetical protein
MITAAGPLSGGTEHADARCMGIYRARKLLSGTRTAPVALATHETGTTTRVIERAGGPPPRARGEQLPRNGDGPLPRTGGWAATPSGRVGRCPETGVGRSPERASGPPPGTGALGGSANRGRPAAPATGPLPGNWATAREQGPPPGTRAAAREQARRPGGRPVSRRRGRRRRGPGSSSRPAPGCRTRRRPAWRPCPLPSPSTPAARPPSR